jgi:hypothetical protein
MPSFIQEELWKQFGAGLDMLSDSIGTCPDAIWQSDKRFSQLAYHTLFFLDYYLTKEPVGFTQPSQFSYSEFEEDPELVIFPKDDLIIYLEDCRLKARDFIFSLDEAQLEKRWINESKTMDFSMLEIVLYNLRHVQHHVGQLNLLLRETSHNAPDWIYRAEI